jgi:hypothetical protein
MVKSSPTCKKTSSVILALKKSKMHIFSLFRIFFDKITLKLFKNNRNRIKSTRAFDKYMKKKSKIKLLDVLG